MRIAFIAFDGFTDVDLFLPWDLMNRVTDKDYAAFPGHWVVQIVADTPTITSVSGVRIERHAPLETANEADAVFIVSGSGSRAKINDPAFIATLRLDPGRQFIAAIDSGALILAKLGLLENLSATTYPSVFNELRAMGVAVEERPFVAHGNVATGGGCLASADLAAWMIEGLIGKSYADTVLMSIAKVGVAA